MRKTLLTFLLLANSLWAISLSDVISASLEKNPSLRAIDARLEANAISVEIAGKFENPQLLLSKNTLDSAQPMSQSVATINQKILYFSKLDSKRKVVLAREGVLKEELKFAKVELVRRIKEEAYAIWELGELKKIINEYVQLTRQNVELHEAYVSDAKNHHMGIMKAKLSLAELEIRESSLNSKIDSAYARLSQLAAFEVSDLRIALEMGEKPDLKLSLLAMTNNPSVAIKDKELLAKNAEVALADANRYPDFNLMLGYAHREKFDDYFNFGVGVSLPIYGTEDAKKEERKAEALSVASQGEDVKTSVNATLKTYYAQMLSAYEIYHIIQDDALGQIEHMFEISGSSISTGGDLFKYVDVLFSKLKLEEKSVGAVSDYARAQAKISALKGELQ
jgi:outer membrane protein, heavy metal efflux system